jgi:Tol biopolymer transport system component
VLEGLVQAPEQAGKGTARVALSFDAWKPGVVRPATVEVPVHVIKAVDSPQLCATLKGHEDAVWQVAWAPDGKTLASLSIDKGLVKLWDVAARKQRATLGSDLGNSYSMAFTPDGKTLILGHHKYDAKSSLTGSISLWDLASGQRKGLLQHAQPRGVGQLVLAADGRTLAASESWKEGEKGAYKHCLTLWDIASAKARTSLAHDADASALAFSPDGKVLAWSVMILKDGQIAAVEVHRRDLAQQQDLPVLSNPAGKAPLNSLTYSADGHALAGADFVGNIVVWDTATNKVLITMKQEDRKRVRSLSFSPDGKLLAAALGNRPGHDHEPGLIVLWDAASGERRLVLTGHTNEVLSVAFSPDGKLLASGGSDRTVRLWDLTTMPASGEARGGM